MLRAASPAGSSCFRAACREEKQAQKQVREAAKRGDVASARLLAKELVRTRKATTQLYTNKAHMIAMGTQLQEQLAMVKVRGWLLGCGSIGIGGDVREAMSCDAWPPEYPCMLPRCS